MKTEEKIEEIEALLDDFIDSFSESEQDSENFLKEIILACEARMTPDYTWND